MFEQGKREVAVGVGVGAQSQHQGLEIGNLLGVRDGAWPLVGIFEAGGEVHDSAVWADLSSLHSALRTTFNATVTAQSEDASPATLRDFKERITTDPRLNVGVQREPDYYASRSEGLQKFITILGYTVAAIRGIGAFFGALNTMYTAVSSRDWNSDPACAWIQGLADGRFRPDRGAYPGAALIRAGGCVSLLCVQLLHRFHAQISNLQPGRFCLQRKTRATASGHRPGRRHRLHRRPVSGPRGRSNASRRSLAPRSGHDRTRGDFPIGRAVAGGNTRHAIF